MLRKTLAVWLFLLAASAAVWADPPADAPVIVALGTGDLISLPGYILGRANAQSSDVVTWNAVTGATKYNVWVLDRTTNAYLTAGENGNYVEQAATTWTPNAAFSIAHIYGACVRAGNGDGWGPYSDWMNFLVGPAGPPAAPTITAMQNYTGNSQHPTITWTALSGAVLGHLSLYDLSTGSLVKTVQLDISAAPSWTCDVQLLDTHTYTVYVAVWNAYGWSSSNWMQFVVGAAAPLSTHPVLVQPEPGTLDSEAGYYVGVGSVPTIQWHVVEAALGYWLELTDASTGTNLANVFLPATSLTPDSSGLLSWTPAFSLLNSHIYAVIVGAANDYGVAWAAAWTQFVVGQAVAPTGTPDLTHPTGYIKVLTPPFAWDGVDGAVAYVLSVYDMIESQTVFYDWVSGSGAAPVTLTTGHSYRAWVIAHNDFGWGNWSDPEDFTVDTTPPVIANLNPSGFSTVYAAPISAQVTDTLSGVNWGTLQATVDGSPAWPWFGEDISTVVLDWEEAEGPHTAWMRIEDNAGNPTEAAWSFTSDFTLPVITATVTPYPGWWTNQDVTVTFSATDGTGSGVQSVTVDHGLVLESTPDHVIVQVTAETETEGLVITGTATDLAGNTATLPVTVYIDKTNPVITASVSPAPIADGWHSGNVTVTFEATDTGRAGVPWLTSPVTVTTEGETDVTGTAIDYAGNSATVSVPVKIDRTAPLISALSPPPGCVLNSPPPCFSASVTDDNGSGVNWDTLSINWNGPAVHPTRSLIGSERTVFQCDIPGYLADGTYTVWGTVEDNVGNVAYMDWPFTVDTTPPVISYLTPGPDELVYYSRPTISATITDGGSGVDWSSLALYLDGVQVIPDRTGNAITYNPPADLTVDNHYVYLSVADLTGKVGTAYIIFTHAEIGFGIGDDGLGDDPTPPPDPPGFAYVAGPVIPPGGVTDPIPQLPGRVFYVGLVGDVRIPVTRLSGNMVTRYGRIAMEAYQDPVSLQWLYGGKSSAHINMNGRSFWYRAPEHRGEPWQFYQENEVLRDGDGWMWKVDGLPVKRRRRFAQMGFSHNYGFTTGVEQKCRYAEFQAGGYDRLVETLPPHVPIEDFFSQDSELYEIELDLQQGRGAFYYTAVGAIARTYFWHCDDSRWVGEQGAVRVACMAETWSTDDHVPGFGHSPCELARNSIRYSSEMSDRMVLWQEESYIDKNTHPHGHPNGAHTGVQSGTWMVPVWDDRDP